MSEHVLIFWFCISQNSGSQDHATVVIITIASTTNREDILCLFYICLFSYAQTESH